MNRSTEKELLKMYGEVYGVEPKDVNGIKTVRTMFYRGKLRTIVKSLIEIKCPIDWDIDYMKEALIDYGYMAVSDSIAGVLPFKCSFTGYNYTTRPTGIIVSVPTMESFNATIGEDCELLFFERRYGNAFVNFQQIINVYAEKLASVDGAIDSNLINTRFGYIIEAETKAQAESIKKSFDAISVGEPLVVVKSGTLTTQKNGLNTFLNNVSNTFIVDRLQDAKRSIMNEFLTAIGINNANTDKRERLNADEVNANNDELEMNIKEFKRNLKKCCEKINALFSGINLDISLNAGGGEREASRHDKVVEDTEQ